MLRNDQLATASRDGHLALRRVERQHALVERLTAAHGTRLSLPVLAREHRVSVRTVARDVERLRLSGLPLDVRRGRGGGVSLPRVTVLTPVALDVAEIAALISSLATLGPTVSPSADSAMRKLAAALTGEDIGVVSAAQVGRADRSRDRPAPPGRRRLRRPPG